MPVPPELAALVREHLDRFGTDPHGRLFRAMTGVDLKVVQNMLGHSSIMLTADTSAPVLPDTFARQPRTPRT